MSDNSVRQCKLAADHHNPLGMFASGRGPSPYEPHSHPFGGQQFGLVACCTRTADCRIEAHLTLGDDGLRHAEVV